MSETVDLVDLDDISDQSILSVVERRFHRNEIYSSIGTILIAVNPYKTVNELYNQQTLNEFAAEDPEFDPSVIFKFEKPHVWMISKNAYYQLKLMKISQAIVISGESGGKKL
jgi:myosin heavy subunit